MSDHPDLAPLLGAEGCGPGGPQRESLLRHVAACRRCRERWVEADPARLFALVALVAPPAGKLERLSETVAAATAWSLPRRSRRRVGAAAVAAAMIAAGLLAGLLWRSRPEIGPARPLAIVERGPAAAIEPRAAIELSAPASARWLDLSVGDTQLIMIFDEGLDL